MLSTRDERWFSLALKIASDSSCKDQHGCVIVKAGRVLAVATNRFVVSHPVSEKYYKRGLHAEQRALIKAAQPLGASVYSARNHKNPHSRPCVMCWSLLGEAGIGWIIYNNGSDLVKDRV